MNKYRVPLGLTPNEPCSYLPKEQQSLAFVILPHLLSSENYNQWLQAGFRRTGNNLYRPQCENCSRCHSLRIDIQHFSPSKSQKRQLNQLSKLEVHFQDTLDKNWFSLYEAYISERHREGAMFPANQKDFLSFIQSHWQETRYLHLYEKGELIAVAITDVFHSAYSAIYSFFAPQHKLSLGSLCVLAQIQEAKRKGQAWLYLGFQIDTCQAMNYKDKFKPNQKYINNTWVQTE